MFEKILVAVDGSAHSKRALDVAADLARHYRSSVFLLHVIRDLSLPREIWEMISAGEVTESRLEILQDSAEIILDNGRRQLAEAGVEDVTQEYLIGDPAVKIAAYAEEHGVGLIVIGHRGLGTQSQMLGSMARKLLNLTPVPCLVVR